MQSKRPVHLDYHVIFGQKAQLQTKADRTSMSIAMNDTSLLSPATARSTAEIRKCFPALERTHNGYPVAYFDGPGGTQVPRSVVEAVTDYLYHHNANTHWAYPTSQETDAIIDSARSVLADFLNASPTEIVFGANMTTLTFHLARALGRGYERDNEILVTELDHHANIAPWRRAELGRFFPAVNRTHEAGRNLRGIERTRDDQQRAARGGNGTFFRRKNLCRCRPSRSA